MAQQHHNDDEAERLQRLSVSPDGFDPALRDQIETSLHAGYAWNAKYAKYGVIWVWFFWVLKWGAIAAAFSAFIVTLLGSVIVEGHFPWIQWAMAVPAIGAFAVFFAIMHNGMAASQRLSEQLAAQYQGRSR
jgi:hypothetical protein